MVTTALVTALISSIALYIRKILFAVGKGLCWIVGFLTELCELSAGLKNISGAAGEAGPVSAFFTGTDINLIYWGLALAGIIFCAVFTVSALKKESGDAGDKAERTCTGIVRSGLRGMALILLMNLVLSAAINVGSALIDRLNYLIVNSREYEKSYDISFDSEDYAAMARSLNTIGNYSLNASCNNRYNLNSCYNDVREDLKQLADKGIFDVTYVTTTYDKNGNSVTVNTWQSVLQSVYRSVGDINREQPLDEYNAKLSEALLEAMEIIKNDASFKALEKYRVNRSVQQIGEPVQLDRMIMLLGSMYASEGKLAVGTGMTDWLRSAYYDGQKDIFSYSCISEDFDMRVGAWLYLTVIIAAFLFIKEMLTMVYNAAARIIALLRLYVSAPSVIAVTPSDNGGELRQWMNAFAVQGVGLGGTVLLMRLVLLFMPVLSGGDFELFADAGADAFARVLMMYGALYTARRASDALTGTVPEEEIAARRAPDTVTRSGRETGALVLVRKALVTTPAAADKSRRGGAGRKKGRTISLTKLMKLNDSNNIKP